MMLKNWNNIVKWRRGGETHYAAHPRVGFGGIASEFFGKATMFTGKQVDQ